MAGPRHVPVEDADDVLKQPVGGSSGTSSNVSTGAGDWLEANPAKRDSSLAREEIALIRHIVPALGDRKVATIKPTDVQGVVDGWNRAGDHAR